MVVEPNVTTGAATVLVVDDDALVRRMLVRALEKDGHRVLQAADGVEGLEMLREHEPDVMLLDIVMPRLDGLGVLAEMKEFSLVAATPVIMISGLDDQDAVIRCIELGADDFLPKPPNPLILRARVNAGLNKKRLRDLQRQHVRVIFSRLLPETTAGTAFVHEAPDTFEPTRQVQGTVMFTDLRGFTTFAESSPVEQVVDVMNRYLAEVTDAVLDEGGTLVASLGDGVIAAFGAPLMSAGHGDQALRAARQIAGPRLDAFNEWVAAQGIYRRFKLGIGLNAGPLPSGDIGADRRLEYTVVGEIANTAARVEGMTKEYDTALLLTQEVVDILEEPPEDLRFVAEAVPRGGAAAMRLWTVG